jgi:hypothetical protein
MNRKIQIAIWLFLIFNYQKAVFAQTAGSVTAGNWYRIAYNIGDRANAEFTLRDFISSGGHSTVSFRVGTSYNYANGVSFSLLSHSYYYNVTFSKIRILQKSTYDQQYLEVYVQRTGSVNYSIYDNLQSTGWRAEPWTLGGIPSGYNSIEFSIDNLFVIGGKQNNFTINRQGNIGIGLVNPVALFQLNSLSTSSTDNGLRFSASNIGPNHSHIFWGSTGDWYIRSASNSGKVIIQDEGGNVGIGNTNPTEKLVVDGKILAEEVKVQTVPASDYVFESDYNLLPLQEVESFIQQNKHLPDIPSAEEFKENGVGLGEMDDMLLRKIEELTLYVIELKKENEEIRDIITVQSDEIKKLRRHE